MGAYLAATYYVIVDGVVDRADRADRMPCIMPGALEDRAVPYRTALGQAVDAILGTIRGY